MSQQTGCPVITSVQDRIISAACQYFSIPETKLLQKSSLHEDVYKRNLCSFLLRENTQLTFESISKRLGYKERTSIHKSVEKIRIHQKIYPQVRHDISNITRLAEL